MENNDKMTSKTSIEAFEELVKGKLINKDCRAVFRALKLLGVGSDTEIASSLGEEDPVNSKKYRPRRSELVEMGLVESCDARVNQSTGKSNTVWRIKEIYSPENSKKYQCASAKEMQNVEKIFKKMNNFQKQKIFNEFNLNKAENRLIF